METGSGGWIEGSTYGVQLLYGERPWLKNVISKDRVGTVSVERFDQLTIKKESGFSKNGFRVWQRIILLTEDGLSLSEVGYRGNPPKVTFFGNWLVRLMHFHDDVGSLLSRMSAKERAKVHYVLCIKRHGGDAKLTLIKRPADSTITELFASNEKAVRDEIKRHLGEKSAA